MQVKTPFGFRGQAPSTPKRWQLASLFRQLARDYFEELPGDPRCRVAVGPTSSIFSLPGRSGEQPSGFGDPRLQARGDARLGAITAQWPEPLD